LLSLILSAIDELIKIEIDNGRVQVLDPLKRDMKKFHDM
jgi:hypothetical protein